MTAFLLHGSILRKCFTHCRSELKTSADEASRPLAVGKGTLRTSAWAEGTREGLARGNGCNLPDSSLREDWRLPEIEREQQSPQSGLGAAGPSTILTPPRTEGEEDGRDDDSSPQRHSPYSLLDPWSQGYSARGYLSRGYLPAGSAGDLPPQSGSSPPNNGSLYMPHRAYDYLVPKLWSPTSILPEAEPPAPPNYRPEPSAPWPSSTAGPPLPANDPTQSPVWPLYPSRTPSRMSSNPPRSSTCPDQAADTLASPSTPATSPYFKDAPPSHQTYWGAIGGCPMKRWPAIHDFPSACTKLMVQPLTRFPTHHLPSGCTRTSAQSLKQSPHHDLPSVYMAIIPTHRSRQCTRARLHQHLSPQTLKEGQPPYRK